MPTIRNMHGLRETSPAKSSKRNAYLNHFSSVQEFDRLIFNQFFSSSGLSGMKGVPIFIGIALVVASVSYAQQPAPSLSPGQPKAPPGPTTKSSPPAQAIVPVPVAPPQPNGPIQKSLV